MRQLRWAAGALDDLDRIAAFSEQRSSQWAHRVQNAITARAEQLLDAPLRARLAAGGDERTVLIADFQYVLTYSVTDAFVIVQSVRHAREIR